jgi:dienelactone hydrolase
MKPFFLPLLLSALVLPMAPALRAQAPDVETKTITYQIGSDTFEGSISRPAKVSGPVPGVLVAHDWMGYGPFSRARAEQLARLGYVALALDMYGKGVHAKNSDEAGKLAAPFYKDFSLFRTRAQAALAELLKQPDVDPKRIGAIGFCFGGTTVLELARSGADIAGIVTFHGGLKTPNPADAKNLKAKELLILHGALDPLVPPADVAGFMKEMNDAAVPYKLVAYPKAVHAFTNPDAGSDITKPVAYNPAAAEAAYKEMQEFFARIFAK